LLESPGIADNPFNIPIIHISLRDLTAVDQSLSYLKC
jgi:hypothetical protein